jgi:hypothetical protein
MSYVNNTDRSEKRVLPDKLDSSRMALVAREQEVRETHAHHRDPLRGPDALQVVEEECPEPKAGEVRVRVLAAGVSLPDLMAREGVHPETPSVPFTPGWDFGRRGGPARRRCLWNRTRRSPFHR